MWLISEQAASELKDAYERGAVSCGEKARLSFVERMDARDAALSAGGLPGVLTIAGDVAEISISGVLTPKPDMMLWFVGVENTTYEDIATAVNAAESDARVSSVRFVISSPGGTVDGFFETARVIESMVKPRSALVHHAASGGYGLASISGKIEAAGPQSSFGSIGVVSGARINPSVVEVTSTDAPYKRLDLTTEAGKAKLREHLDEIHGLFASLIARGRGVGVDVVNTDFGRGAMMLAGAAKRSGMVDTIRGVDNSAKGAARVRSAGSGGRAKGGRKMEMSELRAAYPALCDELERTARNSGVEAERKRARAHVKMAVRTGATEVAFKAITEGLSFDDEEVQADYLAASMDLRDVRTRQEESDAAGAAVSAAKVDAGQDDQPSLAEQIAARRLARAGGK